MSDFNLSAEIDFQLSDSTASRLKKQLEAIPIDVEFDTSKISASVNKELKDLKRGGKAIPVAITVDIANKKTFENYFAKRTVKVKLEISNPKTFKGELEKLFAFSSAGLQAQFAKFISSSKSAAKASGAKNLTGGMAQVAAKSKQTKTAVDAATEAFDELLSRIAELDSRQGASSDAGGFFNFSQDLLNQAKKISFPFGFEEYFKGLDNKSVSNLTQSLRLLFKETTAIDKAIARLTSQGLGSSQLVTDLQSLKANFSKQIFDIGASDPKSFATVLSKQLAPYRDQIGAVSKDTLDYIRLVNKLRVELSKLQGARSPASVVDVKRKQLADASSGRASGLNTSEIKELIGYDEGAIVNLKNIERKSTSSIQQLNAKLAQFLTTDLNRKLSAAGSSIDFGRKLQTIISDAQTSLGRVIDPAAQNSIIQGAKTQFGETLKIANSLNQILGDLNIKEIDFNQRGYTDAADGIRNLRNTLLSLVGAGNLSADNLNHFFKSGLANVDRLKDRSVLIDKFTSSIERLRATLLSGKGADFDALNVGALLTQGQTDVSNIVRGGGPDVETRARSALNQLSANARIANQVNTAIDGGLAKLETLTFQQRTLAGLQAYEGAIDSFRTQATAIAGSLDPAIVKLRQVENLLARVRIQASVEAEGGLLGSIVKLAGLSARRLGAFLPVALPAFAIQSVITESLGAAARLDTQMIRLEQIFAKTYKTQQLVKDETRAITTEMLDLAKTFGVSTDEIGKASVILAQAGFVGKELRSVLDIITRAELGPTFKDIEQTAEAVIAIKGQFKNFGGDYEKVLGGINEVSAKYAVEADGIIQGVRRAGGAFSSAGGDIAGFSAAFTIIKERTREADQAIATGVRNITNRLQRTNVQNYLRDALNIDLRDAQGQFVGFTEAISRIQNQLTALGIQTTDPRYSAIVQKIAGTLQYSRALPLLQDFEKFQSIVQTFNEGSGSIGKDAEIAFGSLENKLVRLKSSFVALFSAIGSSDTFKILLEVVVSVTNGLTKAIVALDKLTAILAGLAAVKLFVGARGDVVRDILGSGLLGNAKQAVKRNTGGLIPGRGPNVDTIPALLTRGEYVIRRQSVDKYGAGFLDRVNRGEFNAGGPVGSNDGGLAQFQSLLKKAGVDITKELLSSFVSGFQVKDSDRFLGNFSPRSKTVTASSGVIGSALESKVMTHEFANAVQQSLDKTELRDAILDLPKKFIDATKNRMERAGTYGSPQDEGFFQKVFNEIFADAFAKLAEIKVRGQDTPESFARLEAAVAKSGITFVDNKATADIGTNNTGLPLYSGASAVSSGKPVSQTVRNGSGAFGYASSVSTPQNIAVAGPIQQTGTGPFGYGGNATKAVAQTGSSLSKLAQNFGKVAAVAGITLGALSALGVGFEDLTSLLAEVVSVGTTAFAVQQAIDFGKEALGGDALKGIFSKLGGSKLGKGVGSLLGRVGGKGLGSLLGNLGGKLSFAVKGLNVFALGVGAVTFALSKFGSYLESQAQKVLTTTTSDEETLSALSKERVGKFLQAPISSSYNAAKGFIFGDEAGDRERTIRTNRALSDTAFRRGSQARAANGGGNADFARSALLLQKSLSTAFFAGKEEFDALKPELQAQAQQLADVFKDMSPEDLDKLQAEASKAGVNLSILFKDLGIEFDPARAAAAVLAMDNLEKLFANIALSINKANAKLAGVDAVLAKTTENLSAIAGDSTFFTTASQTFDILAAGFTPDALGFPELQRELKDTLSKLGRFDPEVARGVQLESAALQAGRFAQERLVGPNARPIQFKRGANEASPLIAVGEAVKDEFSNSLQNAGLGQNLALQLEGAFSDYVDANVENLQLRGDTIRPADLTKFIQDFTDKMGAQSIEFAKRFAAINDTFTKQYSDILSKRINAERAIIELQSKNADIQKEIFRVNNKATGKADQDLSFRQADTIDQTKLGGNFNVRELLAGAVASQNRVSSIANNPNLSNRQRTLLIQREQENQSRIKSGLEYIANGTERLAASARAFDKAAEKAARSAEFMGNALLGTDEDMINAVKGIVALRKVSQENTAGGRITAISNLGQSSRQALNSYVSGQGEDFRRSFFESLGISQNIQASPEAKNLQGELQNQQAANDALISVNQLLIGSFDRMAIQLGNTEKTQLDLVGKINQFGNAVNQFGQQLANMPNLIEHKHVVAPIEVSFIGAGNLEKLQEGFRDVIVDQINQAINNNNQKLRANNKGLNLPAV